MVRVFGLTGGIASGKSTVGKRFASRKIPVIDADQIARQVVEPGTSGLAALVDAFGQGILLPSGELDRKALASLAFEKEERRQTLNAITHPRIAAATHEAIARLSEQGEPLICYEATLLIENGIADAFRPLIVVATPEVEQIRRVRERDNATEEEARARIAAQMPLEEKIQQADLVIDNNGPLDDLIRQADAALDQIIAITGAPRERYFLLLFTVFGVHTITPDQQIIKLFSKVGVAPTAACCRADWHVEISNRAKKLERSRHQ